MVLMKKANEGHCWWVAGKEELLDSAGGNASCEATMVVNVSPTMENRTVIKQSYQ